MDYAAVGLGGSLRRGKGNAVIGRSLVAEERDVCRSIHALFNFEPPATEAEVHDAALQFVRKVAGFTRPSRTNAAAFEGAVAEIATTLHELLAAMSTTAPARDRVIEAERARARARERYA